MKRLTSGVVVLLLLSSQFPFQVFTARAAVTDWIKGASILPTSTTDFGSAPFQQSLKNLKATGATYVALVVPYYQSNTTSSDIGPGYNTPTDAALGSAIEYAHSVGLAVVVKVHNESYTGDWRAMINPSDRNIWFTNFNNELQHVGQIAQAHHAEMFVMGTEMVSVASSKVNSDNTSRWQTLITNIRKIYTGKLTYDANSTNNNNDPFEDEKESIGFWGSLDYVGLSIYYNLNTGDNSVASLSNQWSYWNTNDLKSFQQRVAKPLLFSEVGFRSVTNAHQAPWDSGRTGAYDPTEQVNDYEAFLSYWNGYPYVAGVLWWNWLSDPNGGGAGNTDYTVQNKPAQQTMTKWFTSPTSPGTPGTPPTITSTASANPAGPQTNSTVAITTAITDSGAAVQQTNVDIEIYNAGGTRVYQQVFAGQAFNANETRNYNANWTADPVGSYRVAIGVFSGDWSQNYSWNNNATAISVQAGTTAPPTNPPPGSGSVTDIWWPGSGPVSGVQPFKAMVEGFDVSQYSMYWQVDNGSLNQMGNNSTDYPHKETLVDLSGWKWSANHQYTINFVSKNSQGTVISQKSQVITVQ